MDVTVQPASPEEAGEVAGVVNEAYRHGDEWWIDYSSGDYERTSEAEIRPLAAGEQGGLVLVARSRLGGEAGEAVGAAHVDANGKIGLLSVLPRAQGRGVGAALLAEAERRAKAAGCGSASVLTVSIKAWLAAVYERRGYARTGREVQFPPEVARFVAKPGVRLVELRKSLL